MPAKEYRAGEVVVSYDPDACIHAEECVRGLPSVFDPAQRPWIRPENASADELRAVVAKCPSGALEFRRVQPPASPSPSPAPAASAAVKVVVKTNGPYLVQGPVCVTDLEGKVIKEGTLLALCRCGHSGSKPFCDSSHARVGWRA